MNVRELLAAGLIAGVMTLGAACQCVKGGGKVGRAGG